MKIVTALLDRILIPSQWNFAHTKTMQLSWYVQHFIMIRLLLEEILTNIYYSKVKFDHHLVNGSLYILAMIKFWLMNKSCNRPSNLLMLNKKSPKQIQIKLVKCTSSCIHLAAALHFPISSPFPRGNVSCYKCQHTYFSIQNDASLPGLNWEVLIHSGLYKMAHILLKIISYTVHANKLILNSLNEAELCI